VTSWNVGSVFTTGSTDFIRRTSTTLGSTWWTDWFVVFISTNWTWTSWSVFLDSVGSTRITVIISITFSTFIVTFLTTFNSRIPIVRWTRTDDLTVNSF
jgi:hypothetical protein